jgi:hypothetical protein
MIDLIIKCNKTTILTSQSEEETELVSLTEEGQDLILNLGGSDVNTAAESSAVTIILKTIYLVSNYL